MDLDVFQVKPDSGASFSRKLVESVKYLFSTAGSPAWAPLYVWCLKCKEWGEEHWIEVLGVKTFLIN